MKIGLLGYGKMGKLVEKEALAQGHSIVVKIASDSNEIPSENVDVWIDFSTASAVIPHIEMCGKTKTNIVIGTTGWENDLPLAKQLATKYSIAILYAPNFSLGVHLFRQIIEEAANLIKHYPFYDVSGHEMHHKNKVDVPSGTALDLARQLVKSLERKTPLTFSSTRCGEIPGTHTVIFDSNADTITLTHQARNRTGFALGAVDAAKWLCNKTGFYTFEDTLKMQGE